MCVSTTAALGAVLTIIEQKLQNNDDIMCWTINDGGIMAAVADSTEPVQKDDEIMTTITAAVTQSFMKGDKIMNTSAAAAAAADSITKVFSLNVPREMLRKFFI